MSNEELCLLIQQGHKELISELWNQCVGFISFMADKYVEGWPQLDASAKEDCVQEAFFCFMNAVRLFKPKESSFIYYLSYHLKNAFRTACFGGRCRKNLADPVNHAVSLDMRIGEDGNDLTLNDVVADKEQGDQTEYVVQSELARIEDADFWHSVNLFMHKAFDKSSNETGSAIYHYMLDNDCGFRDAIIGLFGEDALQNKSLMNKLETGRHRTRVDFKNYWNSSRGKEERKKLALDDAAFRYGLRSYGLKHFIEADYTSPVEQIAIRNLANE